MDLKTATGGVCAAAGFKAAGVHCGIRHNKSKADLALILSESECSAAAVYTQNKVKGAPIAVTQKNIADGKAWGIICNSGNANTCNPNGVQIAQETLALLAAETGRQPGDFIIASTGVIGQELSIEPFRRGIPNAVMALSAEGSDAAATAILTTDPGKKEYAVCFQLGGKTCHMGAISKGSGMINPNMATMLCFITTDAAIAPAMLKKALTEAVAVSLNQISVDGDTSTNDTAAILANGMAGNAEIAEANEDYAAFVTALKQVCIQMAKAIAADGEGATKLMECRVAGAPNDITARAIAKSVISSDLFKSAMFGEDANWGRVLCAVGYTPGDFAADNVSLHLQSKAGTVHVCEHSAHNPYSEEEAARVLAEHDIFILLDLHNGQGSGTAWGCDLSYEYVKINGDYRT